MLKQDQSSLKQQYAKALELQQKRQYEQALGVYSQILKLKPDSAEVHYQVGTILFQGNRFQKSAFHLFLAQQIKPNVPEIWIALTKSMVLAMDKSKLDEVKAALKRSGIPSNLKRQLSDRLNSTADGSSLVADKANASDLEYLSELSATGRLVEAVKHAQAVEKKYPQSAAALDLCGEIYTKTGSYKDADRVLSKASKLMPEFWRPFMNLGKLNLAINQPDIAMMHFRDALLYAPRNPELITELGRVLFDLKKYEAAQELFENSIKAFPKTSKGRLGFDFANLLIQSNLTKKGEEIFASARELDAPSAQVLSLIGESYLAIEQYDKAKSYINQALELEPELVHALTARANLYGQLGEFDKADKDYLKLLQISPNNGAAILGYMRTKKGADEPKFVEKMMTLFKESQNDGAKSDLGFALAKALEEQGKYDDAFSYLQSANAIEFAANGYTPEIIKKQDDEFAIITENFNLNTFDGMGYEPAQPIFITGMPRSGTTLAEQIVSAHPLVTAAGELGNSTDSALRRVTVVSGTETVLRPINAIPAKDIIEIGKESWERLRKDHPEGEYVTDKAIGTYQMAGLIQASMPNSKIVVLRRDPRDNLLSIFKNKFITGTHKYANDLEMLAHQYNAFIRRLEFWKSVMPEHIYELHYEKLTANPEKETRKLIEFCGLPWDDACLSPHKSKRAVKTLSIHQVRQPIYTSSVKSWQRYEKHLQPMFNVLKEAGNYPSDD